MSGLLVRADRAAAHLLGNTPSPIFGVRPWWMTVSTVLMLGALGSAVWEAWAGAG